MLLSCCNGKDDGYKPDKNTCFSIIMPLSIKNILYERGKKSQETGLTRIKFLATWTQSTWDFYFNGSVIVFSFIFGIFIAIYSSVWLDLKRRREIVAHGFLDLICCFAAFTSFTVLRDQNINQFSTRSISSRSRWSKLYFSMLISVIRYKPVSGYTDFQSKRIEYSKYPLFKLQKSSDVHDFKMKTIDHSTSETCLVCSCWSVNSTIFSLPFSLMKYGVACLYYKSI